MNRLKRTSAPEDLRDTDTAGPRKRSSTWQIGDVLTLGRERWAIRVLTDETVELEALNTDNIWWRTTLNRLPDKAA